MSFVLSVVKDFVLIGQHTCPKTAMKEMDELYTVFREIYKKWKTDVGYTTSLSSSSSLVSLSLYDDTYE